VERKSIASSENRLSEVPDLRKQRIAWAMSKETFPKAVIPFRGHFEVLMSSSFCVRWKGHSQHSLCHIISGLIGEGETSQILVISFGNGFLVIAAPFKTEFTSKFTKNFHT
jgi:hypothetical protein